MFKKSVLLFIVSLLALSVAACSKNNATQSNNTQTNTQTNTEDGNSDKKVEIRIGWWGGQARADMINVLLDKFEEMHPNITVAREPSPEGKFVPKLTTQAAGGNAPDVFQASSFNFGDFYGRKLYMSLDEFVNSGEIDLSDFNSKDVEAGKRDGKQYLIPWGHIITGVIYNADLFKEAGVDIPELNWTWDEYRDTAKKLKAFLGDDRWAMEDEGGMYRALESFAIQRGKSLYSNDGLNIDKQDLIDWYTMWDQLRKDGVIPPPEIQKEQGGKTQDQAMLARGKVAMFSTSSNQLKTFQLTTKDKLGIVSYPWIQDAKKETPMIISGIGIYEKSKHPKEAATLINWLVNTPEAAVIFLGEHGPPPAQKMKELIVPLISDAQIEESKYFDAMTESIITYPPMPVGSASVQDLILSTNEAIAFGQKSIEQAVDEFFSQAKQMLAK